jgi:hypothetical protein
LANASPQPFIERAEAWPGAPLGALPVPCWRLSTPSLVARQRLTRVTRLNAAWRRRIQSASARRARAGRSDGHGLPVMWPSRAIALQAHAVD